MNIDRLLDKAGAGTISKEALELVVTTLQNPKTTENRYLLLEIIGRSAASEYRPPVESYLHSPEDPWLARQALRILCFQWNLTHDYIEQVVQFVDGVEWDTESDCQLVATTIAGAYLRYYPTGKLRLKLFEKLLKLYEMLMPCI